VRVCYSTELLLSAQVKCGSFSKIAETNNNVRITPRLETNDGFITAQQVRNIRAQLKRMSDHNTHETVTPMETEIGQGKLGEARLAHQSQRVDTEHRGVTGTLVLTDVLDEEVTSILPVE
jgi:hypothetical protein